MARVRDGVWSLTALTVGHVCVRFVSVAERFTKEGVALFDENDLAAARRQSALTTISPPGGAPGSGSNLSTLPSRAATATGYTSASTSASSQSSRGGVVVAAAAVGGKEEQYRNPSPRRESVKSVPQQYVVTEASRSHSGTSTHHPHSSAASTSSHTSQHNSGSSSHTSHHVSVFKRACTMGGRRRRENAQCLCGSCGFSW